MHDFALNKPIEGASRTRNDRRVMAALLPYLWVYRYRVGLALMCLFIAKLTNLGVPIVLKKLIDGMNVPVGGALLVVPIALLVAYGMLRFSAALFNELREFLFAKVTESTVRSIALHVFRHLHTLSLRFHLERQTGGMSRDIERGTRGIQTLVAHSLYSTLPTLIEVSLVLFYLSWRYDRWFAIITVLALICYIGFTVVVTEWRTHLRKQMNQLDSLAHQRAIDSLINFETVKYFGNEAYEAARYDENLLRYRAAALRSQHSLSLLNLGQQCIIAVGLILILWRAATGVAQGQLTLGDLVLVNTLMIQLYIPLNFLGVMYREIKQAMADMGRMFSLLDTPLEVADVPKAPALLIRDPLRVPEIRFEQVCFYYEATRPILLDIDFVIAPGTTTAVVGRSGSGKSTLARLLFRFYDVQSGRILVDGQDIRQVTQESVRAAIGMVPQDTVLFNDTLYYNIHYGRPQASQADVFAAARAAHIHDFIESLPQGYDTPVGERGLKLSGGEKQRVAIARALLKQPQFFLFDEATSALDSRTEQAIQQALFGLSKNRTTLVIAHRLSTIVNADLILVMDRGRIIERGNHAQLLRAAGHYAQMWEIQQSTMRAASPTLG